MRAEADVLIVGLGPVGAALAALLARHGVSVIAAERETDIYRLPRAAHFDAEIMRLFQQLGLAEDILPVSRPISAYEFVTAAREIIMRFSVSAETSQGWAGGYLFHQPALEEALRAKLAAAPEVELALGWSLDTIAQDESGVTAQLSQGGATRTVRARFLIGCDGANSAVRKLSDIGLFDYGFDEPWLVIDTLMPDEGTLPPYGLQVCDPARPTTVMPMSPGRRRWEFMLLPSEDPASMLDDAVVQRLLAPWATPDKATVIRKAVYRFHGLVANDWRKGRILLAGDAAHQMPPFAGQGMCSGLRDAANLAWKLALVLKGEARDTLLDTYQQEREPHVRGMIELAIAMGQLVCMLDPTAAAKRDTDMLAARVAHASDAPAPPPAALAAGCLHPSPRAGELSPQPVSAGARLDAKLGHGFCLVTRGPYAAPAGIAQLDATALDDGGALAAWLGEAEAALIRPDRHVFGTGAPDMLLDRLAASL
ncbi:putative NADH-specific resorcinol 4-hydroxylase [Alphaproteobacteria bacterium SO-S41]|nr:putative NADH-specific resorcinol 4-hydroxylase [Alphaproteobacteria bacterium SO-S41]